MKKSFYLLPVISLLANSLCAQVNPKPFVIPSIQKWEGKEGAIPRGNNYTIMVEKKDTNALTAARILKDDLDAVGIASSIKTGDNVPNRSNVIVLKTNIANTSELGKEGYRLDIDKNIVIAAPYYKGLFWGTRTFLQLLEKGKKENTGISKGTVVDFPQYPSRGFVLDDGRKFFSLEFLKRYVKMLSYYKISEFQIHLNDNGFKKYFDNNWDSTYAGFAIESQTYPMLNKNGEFYTKKEFIELQKMAQQYGVDIIPEIDVPAHSLAITQAIPEIASKKYGADHLDLSNPKTEEVVDNIFREYLQGPNPVFAGPNVHIGTDEYAKEESERFRAFTDHMIRYVQGYGKHVRAWGALTHAKGNTPVTNKDVTLNIWYNGYADPIEMKKEGYKLLSTPDGFLYIVPAAGYYYDYLNLPFLYQKWTPLNIGNVTFQKGDTSLVGGSFAVWNDIVGNGITAMDVHDRVFPALQVIAEKMWSNVTDTNDYKGFERNAQYIGEGLGTENAMRYGFPVNADSVVLDTQIDNKRLEQANILEHLGFSYNVQFDINVGAIKENTSLFADPGWNTYVYLLPNRKIAFYRENYKDTFDYDLPFDQDVQLSFIGSNKDVRLLVNGKVVSHLAGIKIPKGQKDTMFYVQTLNFPFKKIGDKKHPLNGKMSNLKVVVYKSPK
ncbi:MULTISPECIES: family 20 glycosylhydrolase [Chitinophagaceae]